MATFRTALNGFLSVVTTNLGDRDIWDKGKAIGVDNGVTTLVHFPTTSTVPGTRTMEWTAVPLVAFPHLTMASTSAAFSTKSDCTANSPVRSLSRFLS